MQSAYALEDLSSIEIAGDAIVLRKDEPMNSYGEGADTYGSILPDIKFLLVN